MFCRPKIIKMVINDVPLNVKETDLKVIVLSCNFHINLIMKNQNKFNYILL